MQLCSMPTICSTTVMQLRHQVHPKTVHGLATSKNISTAFSTSSRGVADWQLHAISRLNEADQPSSYRATAAAALDVRPRDLVPAISTPKQHPASTGWQPFLQSSPADAMVNPGQSVGQHSTPAAAISVDAGQRHIHAAFGAFFCYLGLVTAAATSPDWYLDAATFGGLWGLLWAVSARLKPSANTATLVCLLPVMHLAGALGMYTWELGNLSWDVLVHISNGFIGTLLFASVLAKLADHKLPAHHLVQPQGAGVAHAAVLADLANPSGATSHHSHHKLQAHHFAQPQDAAAGHAAVLADLAHPRGPASHHSNDSHQMPAHHFVQLLDAAAGHAAVDAAADQLAAQATSCKAGTQALKPRRSSSSSSSSSSGTGGQHSVQGHAWLVLKVTGLLLLSTSLIEVVEAAGGQVAGHVGEGIFLRGPGDFCTASLPCSEEVDTAKDMVDNCAGMMLALIALATRGSSHPHASNSNNQAGLDT